MTTNVDSLENGGGKRRGRGGGGWGDGWGDWRGLLKRCGVKSTGGNVEYASSTVDRGAGERMGFSSMAEAEVGSRACAKGLCRFGASDTMLGEKRRLRLN